jgi:hypothetical protein
MARRAWSSFCFLYVQVSLYYAMSFLFKPPFVAAFRNLVSLQWASSSSCLLLHHLTFQFFAMSFLFKPCFVAASWPLGFVCSFICFVFFVLWNYSCIFFLTFNLCLQCHIKLHETIEDCFSCSKLSACNLSSWLVKPWSSCAYKAYIQIYKWDGVLLFIWWHKN